MSFQGALHEFPGRSSSILGEHDQFSMLILFCLISFINNTTYFN